MPSLASWGPELVALGKEYILACVDYLDQIQKGKPLNSSERLVIRIGLATVEKRRFFTPFHPLVLAYYLNLVEEIVEDGEARSF